MSGSGVGASREIGIGQAGKAWREVWMRGLSWYSLASSACPLSVLADTSRTPLANGRDARGALLPCAGKVRQTALYSAARPSPRPLPEGEGA